MVKKELIGECLYVINKRIKKLEMQIQLKININELSAKYSQGEIRKIYKQFNDKITVLYDLKQREQDEKLGNERRSKIGTGDRAEKIRTYNYPQNRLTDHRINYTVMHLDKIMEGDLEDLIQALIAEDERMRMEESNDK